MRSKYEQDSFAVFQGTIFSATTNNGYVELLTTDRKLAKKFNFLLDGDIYYKDISPYDVTEYYEQRFEAKYKGILQKKGLVMLFKIYLWIKELRKSN